MDTLQKSFDPSDRQYKSNRQYMLKELFKQSDRELKDQIDFLASQPPPVDDEGVAVKMFHNIRTLDMPNRVKSILDSTSGTTGSVLIRQDLEPILYSLFVRKFPLFEAITKQPSNGLVHTAA